jgi:hypothetical protein
MNQRYREEMEADDDEHVIQPAPEPEELSAEEQTFKKRYGDLRRFQADKDKQNESRIKALEEQLAVASKAQIKYPKTEEEVSAWMERFPDVAKIIQTIVLKGNENVLEEVNKVKQEAAAEKAQAAAQRAYLALLKIHPDFEQLIETDDFKEWLPKQSSWVSQALYENDTDVQFASDAVDFYKAHLAKTKREKREEAPRNDRSAAYPIRTPRSDEPGNGKVKWTESQVERLSERDYYKHEAEIDKARQSPEFYDISGAAR